MKKSILDKSLLRSTVLTGALAVAGFGMFSGPAFAQPVDEVDDAATVAAAEEDRIIVTGSRVARDEFTSAAPLQTYDTEAARQIGVTSITELLQRSTVVNGQQIDGTLNTNAGNSNATEAPPTGGVGSANIGLRGLDPERTLVLVNGRRLGSAGVRGAPAQPDINLLPLSLVKNIEVITEGASAIYGADAVAGVVNLILRDDFEGLELSTSFDIPEASGGLSKQFSFLLGAQGDRSHIVIGGEYNKQDRILLGDRIDCRRSLVDVAATGQRLTECRGGFFDNVLGVVDGSLTIPGGDIFTYYIPGLSAADSDLGIANFGSAFLLPEEFEEDGSCERADQRCRFTAIPFYSDEEERLNSDLLQPLRRISAVALGGFEFDAFEGEHEVFFETYFFNRLSDARGPGEQIFPTIPGLIPQEDANGNIIVDGTGAPILVDNPLNPFPGNVNPILTLSDLRQDRLVELSQYRFVGGLRGDLFANSDGDWTYETFFTYDRSIGFASQPLMNETNLNLALNSLRLDSSGNPICGVPAANNDFGFITGQGCVPINFFADDIYTGGSNGDGAFTDAERRFLIGQRTNRTVVEQILFGGYVSGDLFELPAGAVSTAFGGEWRRDRIDSATDFLSSAGDNAAENPLTEEPTRGSRSIWDIYGEFVAPIISDGDFIQSWVVEGAVRYTNESNFGDEITYRARTTVGFNDWMTLSGSYGTSFRAPNLREQFLAPQQQGTSSRNDPCTIPAAANVGGVFVPANDTRSATVISNCIANGADPTQLGINATITIPVTVGGNAGDLLPETSRAYTATLQLQPPVSDAFDLAIAVSFFDIRVEDNIRSLSPETLLTRCFDSTGLSSDLCSRLTRGANPDPTFNFINFIDASFVNVGVERSQGVDINTRINTSFDGIIGDAPLDVIWNGALTLQTKRTEVIFSDDPVDDLRGDFGNPKTRLQSTFVLSSGQWEAVFDTRWQSGTGPSQDALSNVDFQCAGPTGVPAISTNFPGSPEVFLVCDAASRLYQDASLTYRVNNVAITGGVNNVFDKQPPLISAGLGSNRGGRVTSSGYDQIGRSFFISLTGAF